MTEYFAVWEKSLNFAAMFGASLNENEKMKNEK